MFCNVVLKWMKLVFYFLNLCTEKDFSSGKLGSFFVFVFKQLFKWVILIRNGVIAFLNHYKRFYSKQPCFLCFIFFYKCIFTTIIHCALKKKKFNWRDVCLVNLIPYCLEIEKEKSNRLIPQCWWKQTVEM